MSSKLFNVTVNEVENYATHAPTPEVVRNFAYALGADEVEVHAAVGGDEVDVRTTGLTVSERQDLHLLIEERTCATKVAVTETGRDVRYETDYEGLKIVITEDGRAFVGDEDVTDQYKGRPLDRHTLHQVKADVAAGKVGLRGDEVLADAEFLRVMRAVPDYWEPGDDLEVADLDWSELEPLVDKYGGLPELVGAIKRTAAESPDEREDTQGVRAMETSSAPAQRPESDSVEQAKTAYVDGDIGVVELEDRLEEVIELDYEPTAHPS